MRSNPCTLNPTFYTINQNLFWASSLEKCAFNSTPQTQHFKPQIRIRSKRHHVRRSQSIYFKIHVYRIFYVSFLSRNTSIVSCASDDDPTLWGCDAHSIVMVEGYIPQYILYYTCTRLQMGWHEILR